jgi:predicted transcriptional regulator
MLMSPEFHNQRVPPPFRFREANQSLNNQIQAQKALLITQNQTIQDTQHTLLEFKKMAEEMVKARVEPQAQQTLLMTQKKTIHDAQQTTLEFKKVAEEMAKDRVKLLKIIEGLMVNQVAQEAEMTRLKVYHLSMTKHHIIHVLGAEGAGVSGHTSKNQACQCNGYSAISPSH